MLKQNLEPQQDQDKTAGGLSLLLITAAKYIADLNTDSRHDKGNDANQ